MDSAAEPPSHSCCSRLCLGVTGLLGIALCIPTSLFWLFMLLCLAATKICVYHCCCDDDGKVYMEALVWSACYRRPTFREAISVAAPFRWIGIACSGRGYLWPSQAAAAMRKSRTIDTAGISEPLDASESTDASRTKASLA